MYADTRRKAATFEDTMALTLLNSKNQIVSLNMASKIIRDHSHDRCLQEVEGGGDCRDQAQAKKASLQEHPPAPPTWARLAAVVCKTKPRNRKDLVDRIEGS